MEVYKGRTPIEEYDQLMEMLNNVFFLEDDEVPKRDFLSLLPKLYTNKEEACYNNVCVMEDGVIKGAIGLFPLECDAAGQKLKIGGIGNVAVARDARGAGHMVTCMNLCLEEMIKDGTDFSLLGGQRQRYGFFGYEPAGVCYDFDVNTGNLYRELGKGYPHPFTARLMTEDDTLFFEKFLAYKNSFPQKTIYKENTDFLQLLRSWKATPYVVLDGEEPKGYFSVSRNGKGVHEILAFEVKDMFNVCIAAMDTLNIDGIGFSAPAYNTELCEFSAAHMSGYSMDHVEMINILNYENFIRGFLGVKATYDSLCDGKIVILFHGYRCDEQLCIEVKDNKVSVTPTTETPDMEITHREGIRLIAALYSKDRLALPANVRSWFPLPFYWTSHDGV